MSIPWITYGQIFVARSIREQMIQIVVVIAAGG